MRSAIGFQRTKMDGRRRDNIRPPALASPGPIEGGRDIPGIIAGSSPRRNTNKRRAIAESRISWRCCMPGLGFRSSTPAKLPGKPAQSSIVVCRLTRALSRDAVLRHKRDHSPCHRHSPVARHGATVLVARCARRETCQVHLFGNRGSFGGRSSSVWRPARRLGHYAPFVHDVWLVSRGMLPDTALAAPFVPDIFSTANFPDCQKGT